MTVAEHRLQVLRLRQVATRSPKKINTDGVIMDQNRTCCSCAPRHPMHRFFSCPTLHSQQSQSSRKRKSGRGTGPFPGRSSVKWSLENPRSSRLFEMVGLAKLLAQHHVIRVEVDYCMYGERFQKPTMSCINFPKDVVIVSTRDTQGF